MAVGDLVTADWEFEFRGFAFGADDSDFLIAPGVQGLANNAEVAPTDRTRLRRDGLHPGDDFLLGRQVIIPVEVSGADEADWEANRSLLKTATRTDRSRGEDWLVFQVPGIAGGGKRRILCRPRGLATDIDLDYYYNLHVELVRFVATKPFIYDDSETTVFSGILSASSSGLTWPLTWPLNWGTVSASSFTATNAGDTAAEWRANIPGPVTNPVLTHVTKAESLVLEITVADGDYLEIDSDARTILLNGTASRFSALTTNEWFTLDPGANELTYRADSGTSTVSITYRSTWS